MTMLGYVCRLAGTEACRNCQYHICSDYVACQVVSKSQGWECPKCSRVNAPWVSECPCYRERRVPMSPTEPSDTATNPFTPQADTSTYVWTATGPGPTPQYVDPMDGTRRTDAAGNRLP
jgi:hypothetical protein